MSLEDQIRGYLATFPGASVRVLAVALGQPPATIQNACWAGGIDAVGLADAAAILQPIVEGGASMYEVLRRTRLSREAIEGVCRGNGWPVPA